MPSADKLFTLDPVRSQQSSLSTQGRVQGASNRSVENAQLVGGLQAFSTAIGSLAETSKQKQIAKDTRLAQNAAIRGEEEPLGLLGVASDSYDRIVEGNAFNSILGEVKAFQEGQEGYNLTNAEGPLSTNLANVDTVYDNFLQEGLRNTQNPDLQQDFASKLELQRNSIKRDVTKVDNDRKKLQVIERITNISKDVIAHSKITATELKDNITTAGLDRVSKETANLGLGIELPEAKLLTLQIFSQNPDVLADPQLMNDLMKGQFSKGITYNTLYLKGIQAGNTDEDAKQLVNIRNKYLIASEAYFKDLDDTNKATATRIKDAGTEAMLEVIKGGGSSADAAAVGTLYNLAAKDINTLIKAEENLNENFKFDIDSEQGISFKKEILRGAIVTPAAVKLRMHTLGIAQKHSQYYIDLATNETNQVKGIQEAYDSQISQLKSKQFSVLKSELSSTVDIFNKDGSINQSAVFQMAFGSNLDAKDAQQLLDTLQDLDLKYDAISANAARNGATTDNFNIGNDLQSFRSEYNDDFNRLIDNIRAGDIGAPFEAPKPVSTSSTSAATTLVIPPTATENHDNIINNPKKFVEDNVNDIVATLEDTEGKFVREETFFLPQEEDPIVLRIGNPDSPFIDIRKSDVVSAGKKALDTEASLSDAILNIGTALSDAFNNLRVFPKDRTLKPEAIEQVKDKPETKNFLDRTLDFLSFFSDGEIIDVQEPTSPISTSITSSVPKPAGKVLTDIDKTSNSITKASKEFKVDPKHLKVIVALESFGGKNVKNIPKKGEKASSASGPFQIVDATAKTLASRMDTTQELVQNDIDTNVRAGSLLFSDAMKRYKDTSDPIIFAIADQHLGAKDLKAARNKAEDGNNMESVLKQITNSDTVTFIQKAQKELNK